MLNKLSLAFVIVATAIVLPGCTAGLKLWQKDRHFQTELSPKFAADSVDKVAIYVFSEGEAVDGKDVPVDALDVIGSILMFPVRLVTGSFSFGDIGGTQIGLHQTHFPYKVEKGITFEPDIQNAGPSLEFANSVKERLLEKGYPAEVVTTMDHSGEIPLADVLANARNAGYDAAFIVYYKGLTSWTEYAGTNTIYTGRTRVVTTNVTVFNGFLFVPNAGMFDVNTGEQMWSYQNYGMVQKAHLPNLANEPFVSVVSEVLVRNGAEDYVTAAKNAAKLLFDPAHWQGSYKDIPKKGDGKRRM